MSSLQPIRNKKRSNHHQQEDQRKQREKDVIGERGRTLLSVDLAISLKCITHHLSKRSGQSSAPKDCPKPMGLRSTHLDTLSRKANFRDKAGMGSLLSVGITDQQRAYTNAIVTGREQYGRMLRRRATVSLRLRFPTQSFLFIFSRSWRPAAFGRYPSGE
jgi:hypothetical protein